MNFTNSTIRADMESVSQSRMNIITSPEDEQSILFETSRPQRLFSEPTLLT